MELRDRLQIISRDASEPLRRGLRSLNGEDPDLEAIRSAPDRDRDGFDVAVWAALHLGARALAHRDHEEARRLATTAMRDAPNDPLPRLLAALAADPLHLTDEAYRMLADAHTLAPDEPAIDLALSRRASDAGAYDEAADAVDRYVAAVPEDARARSWQARMRARADATERFDRRDGSGIRVLHPGIDHRRIDTLIASVRGAMDEAARLLARDRRPELTVVVYEDIETMRLATCAPSWSGGVFDGVLHLASSTLTRPEGERTVRHESTHAQLALIRGSIPHWFNEGLAQHMEGPASRSTRSSWSRMVERRFWIPFASLEGQLVVIEDPGDARLAYHQSLAMVRYLMERRGVRAVREAADAIERGEATDLLEQLVPGADGDALLAYLSALGPHVPNADTPTLAR